MSSANLYLTDEAVDEVLETLEETKDEGGRDGYNMELTSDRNCSIDSLWFSNHKFMSRLSLDWQY